MLRPELIKAVEQRYPHLRTAEVERAVQAVLDGISEALARGDRVELHAFGAFSVRQRSPRKARNPRNGAPVEIAAKKVPVFRASKALRKRLNDRFGETPPDS